MAPLHCGSITISLYFTAKVLVKNEAHGRLSRKAVHHGWIFEERLATPKGVRIKNTRQQSGGRLFLKGRFET